MEDDIQLATCPREGCHPDDDDGCIEGLALKDCPNRHPFVVPQDSVEEPSIFRAEVTPPGTVRVHNGEAYTTEEADIFLRRKNAVVIAFLGCPNTGKTTAAVMLYELLKRRRLPSLGFAGSNTIRGFQRRSFKSLLASGLRIPDTDRTSGNKPVQFLHLRVCTNSNQHAFHDMLLSDRTGEDFEACIAKPNLCASYPEIPRADWHVLLVDGKKLIKDDKAALHISEVRKIFASLVKTEIGNLQVVLTKFDKVSASVNKVIAVERFDALVADLKKRSKGLFAMTAHNLAARPSSDDALTGFGLDELVMAWFASDAKPVSVRKHIPILVDGAPYDMLLNTIQAI